MTTSYITLNGLDYLLAAVFTVELPLKKKKVEKKQKGISDRQQSGTADGTSLLKGKHIERGKKAKKGQERERERERGSTRDC